MNYKDLFHKLEISLDRILLPADRLETLSAIVHGLVETFHETLGLSSCRIYEREGDFLVLREEYPDTQSHEGFRISVSYEPVQTLLHQGWVLHDLTDPGVDREIEDALGVGTFAAISVGVAQRTMIAFSLADSSDREHVIYILNMIRHVINLKIRQQHLEDRLAQTRSIQMSLLPSQSVRFAEYDVWGSISSAEEVGGDLYDFIRLSERSLGIAIVDASGHGLPAALQARDAIIGLRMGIEDHLRISSTIEKLNRVISSTAMISSFITLFYCEVEPSGNLIYCNAGHSPPLLLQNGEIAELDQGGLVLGPNPDALYDRGFACMEPGAVLLAFTDGIVEAASSDGEMFGTERLKQLLTRQAWESAEALTSAVFEEVNRFSPAQPPLDDQTVVAVIRRSAGSSD